MWARASTTALPSWVCRWLPTTAGNGPYDKERFVNARAEDYWNLREIFAGGEVDVDELDDVLAAQLGSIKWTIGSRGRTKIESKDDMRKQGLPSSDRADTLAMVMPRRATAGIASTSRITLATASLET